MNEKRIKRRTGIDELDLPILSEGRADGDYLQDPDEIEKLWFKADYDLHFYRIVKSWNAHDSEGGRDEENGTCISCESFMEDDFNEKQKEKPCLTLKYCPYGVLVEQFPLPETAEH